MAEAAEQRIELAMIFHPRSPNASVERLSKLAGIGRVKRPVEITRLSEGEDEEPRA